MGFNDIISQERSSFAYLSSSKFTLHLQKPCREIPVGGGGLIALGMYKLEVLVLVFCPREPSPRRYNQEILGGSTIALRYVEGGSVFNQPID